MRAVFEVRAMVKEWILLAIFAQILLVLLNYEGLVGSFHIRTLL